MPGKLYVESLLSDLDQCTRTPRVEALRKIYFRAMPEMCIERPDLVTRFQRDNGLFGNDRISILDKARVYRHVLENREPVVRHEYIYESRGPGEKMRRTPIEDASPFAGSTTSKFKGVPLYPEFLASSLWPELWTISTRTKNPYYLGEEDANKLNREIFPFWMDENILEKTRAECEKAGKDTEAFRLMQFLAFFMASKANCISHTIPDFSRVVDKGLAAIIAEAREKRDDSTEPDQREFYDAVVEGMEGIVAYSRNLSDKAGRMALEESDEAKKKELLEIGEIYSHVPRLPARTYRDGLTSIWVCWTAIHIENPNIGLSLGRLDQVLYDLYRNDIAANTMTVEEALELTCCFWLKIGDHVPMIPEAGEQLFGGTGSNQAITIGGVRPDDRGEPGDAVNDLTYIMLKATELMQLRDPNLNARYHAGTHQPEYLEMLCRTNMKTGATPALHNDKAVIEALRSRGDTLAEARDYGVVGCVEPVSNGRAYTASASILLNLPSVLELTLYNGRHRHTGMDRLISKETGPPENFRSFEEFKGAFLEQLKWMGEITTGFNDELGETHRRYYPTPILSSLFEGPMDKGKDLIEDGARINAHGVSIIGLADVVDSLNAIEKVIYNEPRADFPGLLRAMDNDFEDDAALLERLKSSLKYGDDSPEAKVNPVWLVESIDDCFREKEGYRGGRYRVGYWSMTNHAGFGRLTGALPSGRKSGENLASGSTPASGAVPELPSALNGVAALPARCVTNGMAFNIKYTPPLDEDYDAMKEHFKASVKSFFGGRDETGGMEIQFNIKDHRRFEDAVEHPEQYKDLLVRVSGYTAYFVDLNPRMQKEIIDRTEYDISGRRWRMKEFDPFPLQKGKEGVDLSWIDRVPGVGFLTDNLLELLFRGMDLSFLFSRGYRRNIENYRGRLLFRTREGDVSVAVRFDDGDMKMDKNPDPDGSYDVRILFKDESALLEYLFSDGQDILNVMLENDVELDGNLNHIYRFGYLAKDLQHRIMGRA